MLSNDSAAPVDRPNLSKDYLGGSAPEDWVPLRGSDWYADNNVTLELGSEVTALDPKAKTVTLGSGASLPYDKLLLATGAEPVKLPVPGADLPHVHVLRTLDDSRAIAAAGAGKRAVIIGASFIGLEAAAALRARGADVTVVAPEAVPLARVLGDEVGAFIRRVHEGKGVQFRLGRKPASISADAVTLDDGTSLPADVVVMGVGVRPRLALAEAAGLTIDRGVVVDQELRAAPRVWACGDIARYPLRGDHVRIEHWQVAVRQGQAVARAILGRAPRRDVPFFWSAHHDVTIGYVGHAEAFDRAEVHGDLDARDAHVVYRHQGRVKAVATINRDALSLEVEAAMEREDFAALDAIVSAAR
jgi:NADPH-dependent 2,4-dienoyl-CoA reductase/sulfur reductase-like enzyme